MLVTDASILRRVAPHLPQLQIAVILCRVSPGTQTPAGVTLYADVLASGKGARFAVAPRTAEDVAMLMYTSGSTGHPKGVAQTNRGVVTQLDLGVGLVKMIDKTKASFALPARPHQEAVCCPVPLFHVTACHHIFLQSIVQGRKLVLMPKWDAALALEIIATEKITFFTGVPTMVPRPGRSPRSCITPRRHHRDCVGVAPESDGP